MRWLSLWIVIVTAIWFWRFRWLMMNDLKNGSWDHLHLVASFLHCLSDKDLRSQWMTSGLSNFKLAPKFLAKYHQKERVIEMIEGGHPPPRQASVSLRLGLLSTGANWKTRNSEVGWSTDMINRQTRWQSWTFLNWQNSGHRNELQVLARHLHEPADATWLQLSSNAAESLTWAVENHHFRLSTLTSPTKKGISSWAKFTKFHSKHPRGWWKCDICIQSARRLCCQLGQKGQSLCFGRCRCLLSDVGILPAPRTHRIQMTRNISGLWVVTLFAEQFSYWFVWPELFFWRLPNGRRISTQRRAVGCHMRRQTAQWNRPTFHDLLGRLFRSQRILSPTTVTRP